jgi:YgiT-type zinc finger domain-containing protein
MFKCYVCESSESHLEYVNEVFEIGNKFHLVENIPATVCSRCGAKIFSGETSEAIRVMLHSKPEPTKSVVLDVFSYQQSSNSS